MLVTFCHIWEFLPTIFHFFFVTRKIEVGISMAILIWRNLWTLTVLRLRLLEGLSIRVKYLSRSCIILIIVIASIQVLITTVCHLAWDVHSVLKQLLDLVNLLIDLGTSISFYLLFGKPKCSLTAAIAIHNQLEQVVALVSYLALLDWVNIVQLIIEVYCQVLLRIWLLL